MPLRDCVMLAYDHDCITDDKGVDQEVVMVGEQASHTSSCIMCSHVNGIKGIFVYDRGYRVMVDAKLSR